MMPDRPGSRNKVRGNSCEICKIAQARDVLDRYLCADCERTLRALMATLLELSGGSIGKPVDLEELIDLTEKRLDS